MVAMAVEKHVKSKQAGRLFNEDEGGGAFRYKIATHQVATVTTK
jgi:hypothetical protein